ncbi:MAG: DUF4194 domain-containing protein, partial [Chloroflexota bacterium]
RHRIVGRVRRVAPVVAQPIKSAQKSEGVGNLIMSVQDIYEMMGAFMDDLSDERKSIDQVSRYSKQLVRLGLLRPYGKSKDRFIVERVIKSRITSDVLNDLKEKLKQHVAGETP